MSRVTAVDLLGKNIDALGCAKLKQIRPDCLIDPDIGKINARQLAEIIA